MPLLARDDSLLVVIDLQPGFSAGDRPRSPLGKDHPQLAKPPGFSL
jgi:hypothetical protein